MVHIKLNFLLYSKLISVRQSKSLLLRFNNLNNTFSVAPSLINKKFNYDRKSFYSIGPNFLKLFTGVIKNVRKCLSKASLFNLV